MKRENKKEAQIPSPVREVSEKPSILIEGVSHLLKYFSPSFTCPEQSRGK